MRYYFRTKGKSKCVLSNWHYTDECKTKKQVMQDNILVKDVLTEEQLFERYGHYMANRIIGVSTIA